MAKFVMVKAHEVIDVFEYNTIEEAEEKLLEDLFDDLGVKTLEEAAEAGASWRVLDEHVVEADWSCSFYKDHLWRIVELDV